jgi:MmyB-like transcription regulator ligand binding domain/Glycosyl hydrolase family 65 central catalytic domain
MGPHEFHDAYPHAERPGLDDSAYTTVMVARTLRRSREVLGALASYERQELIKLLEVEPDEPARWDDMTRRLVVPFHGDRIISQYPGDRGIINLVYVLVSTSGDFARRWDEHAVEVRRTHATRIDHSDLGVLEFTAQVLHLPDSDQRLILYIAAPGRPTAAAFHRMHARSHAREPIS